jgi:hypothetical protein
MFLHRLVDIKFLVQTAFAQLTPSLLTMPTPQLTHTSMLDSSSDFGNPFPSTLTIHRGACWNHFKDFVRTILWSSLELSKELGGTFSRGKNLFFVLLHIASAVLEQKLSPLDAREGLRGGFFQGRNAQCHQKTKVRAPACYLLLAAARAVACC